MHSWSRSLVLPAASITISVGSSDHKRRPTPRPTRSAEGSPKPWMSSLLAHTLITSMERKGEDQLRNGKPGESSAASSAVSSPTSTRRAESTSWSGGCNLLSGMSCTSKSSVVPLRGEEAGRQVNEGVNDEVEQADDDEVDSNLVLRTAIASSSLRVNGGANGTLSANVSSTQLEELVMKSSTDSSKPLVILFGWAGCRDRYLAKYAQYYESQGYAVARFTVPISKIRSFSSYRRYALQIYEEVLQTEPTRPLFFHCFSMNGCSLFTALWDLLAHLSDGPDIKQRVRGLIFDSSPANVLPWQAANAVSFAMFPPTKFGAIPRESCRLALAGLFSVHRAMVWLQSNFNPESYEKHYAYFRLLKFADLPRNQLFLYSDADDICVRESIEEFQRAQQDRRVRVRHQNFRDSKHCEHFRTHTDGYIRSCVAFTEESLRDENPRITN